MSSVGIVWNDALFTRSSIESIGYYTEQALWICSCRQYISILLRIFSGAGAGARVNDSRSYLLCCSCCSSCYCAPRPERPAMSWIHPFRIYVPHTRYLKGSKRYCRRRPLAQLTTIPPPSSYTFRTLYSRDEDAKCRLFFFFIFVILYAHYIDRFVMIAYPSRYSTIYTRKSVAWMVAFCWLFSFSILLPTLTGVWGKFTNSFIGLCPYKTQSNLR